ncbi:E3 ubiquitin-protein ligase MIB1-like [Centruroides sculpturatus]|uniref:E3 ubiquitin-protein ligase MIB1-like n=1 Tax=Centruroides sculpturatus TaxID=218467 RepID=UPI000C6E4E3C|nr:E3 ubiquitin-protein ligase MIB1-like [Centruroides sculpturatus]
MSSIKVKEITSDQTMKSETRNSVCSARSLVDLNDTRANSSKKKYRSLLTSIQKKCSAAEEDPDVGIFHKAICKNDEEKVRRMLDNGMDPNAEEIHSRKIPLIEATKRGFDKIVRTLLIAHADVNRCNHQGTTALHACMRPTNFNQEIIQLFLECRNANFNIQDKLTGSSPLHILTRNLESRTIKTVSLEKVKAILEELVPRCNINLKDVMGNTPLHILAKGKEDDVETVEIFLSGKPDVNVRNHLGETPLATAINNGNYKMALAILKHDVDLGIRDRYECTALHHAARKNSVLLVAKLLEKGSDVNAQDPRGDTALHIAAGRGLVDVATVLLEHPEVNINKQNEDGFTPLMCAVDSYFTKIVKMLLDKNCDLDIKSDQVNKDALDIAKEHLIKRKKRDIYQLLCEKKNISKKQNF